MIKRKADAVWEGDLQAGNGTVNLGSGAYSGPYSFTSRFGDGSGGTNPEELVGAAHAGCYSMALAAGLGKSGFQPKIVRTNATVHLEKDDAGFFIKKIELVTEADVPGIDDATFQEHAENTKKGCPISRSLGADIDVQLTAKLVK